MKVGIVSPYFGTIGGGERYTFSVAKFFLNRGDKVDIFSGDRASAKIVHDFFGLDLESANFVPDIFFRPGTSIWTRLATSAKYNLIFFLSDGSIPVSLAGHNWLHFQTPFQNAKQKNLLNKLKLSRFENVICNSKFTKLYIDKTYGIHSKIVYPPVDVENFIPGKKENIILATGRFSDPTDFSQHAKKQEVLIRTFAEMVKSGLTGWRLILAGSTPDKSSVFIKHLQSLAKKLPVEMIINPDFPSLRKQYASARIFWHAVGYGENLEANPARAEHFGITTVEAMASGAVPIVFSGGGQREIVQQDNSGFLWETISQLKNKTLLLIENEELREQMAKSSRERSQIFSTGRFFDNLKELI